MNFEAAAAAAPHHRLNRAPLLLPRSPVACPLRASDGPNLSDSVKAEISALAPGVYRTWAQCGALPCGGIPGINTMFGVAFAEGQTPHQDYGECSNGRLVDWNCCRL